MTDPLTILRDRFVARCQTDLAELHRADITVEARALIIHRLAGSAGSFSFRELGEIAARLDASMREGRALGAADLAELEAALEGVQSEHG